MDRSSCANSSDELEPLETPQAPNNEAESTTSQEICMNSPDTNNANTIVSNVEIVSPFPAKCSFELESMETPQPKSSETKSAASQEICTNTPDANSTDTNVSNVEIISPFPIKFSYELESLETPQAKGSETESAASQELCTNTPNTMNTDATVSIVEIVSPFPVKCSFELESLETPQAKSNETQSAVSREICTNTSNNNNTDTNVSNVEILSPFPANCSIELKSLQIEQGQRSEADSATSRQICLNTTDTNNTDTNVSNVEIVSPYLESALTFELDSQLSYFNSDNLVNTAVNTSRTVVPLVLVNGGGTVVTQQPQRCPRINSDLPSPASVITGQPQTLFVQALAKLNESSLSVAVMNHFRTTQLPSNTSAMRKMSEPSPPDSLTSAPPSYSFVLRQMARRRPRIVGTFIPSPSFIQHTPPPNYGAAFDIYVESPIPAAPRVYNFGFASMPVVCPGCGFAGMSMVHSKVTLCTHLCAVILCILCCWVCAPLPYILRSCKDVYHYCSNCRTFLGMYCPTNPENALN